MVNQDRFILIKQIIKARILIAVNDSQTSCHVIDLFYDLENDYNTSKLRDSN